ncbi:MAG: hypothetical protein J7L16_01645 [Deltaproteobacteria bacterium]|nr:hypothetical protein [Deltaproteobacteria bacterium]
MKKAVLSPLCSGVVIPGLGQVINHQLKKGGAILIAVFILFSCGITILYHIIKHVMIGIGPYETRTGVIIDKFKSEDFSLIWCLLAALAVIWLYSVVDAYLTGKKLDQNKERDRL